MGAEKVTDKPKAANAVTRSTLRWATRRFFLVSLCCGAVFALLLPSVPGFAAVRSASRAERVAFQRSIVDYRSHLNPKFKKVARKTTKYIIVHTSEGGLASTLRVVSGGKRMRRRWRTEGGHAHYVIGRDGKTYRILDRQYKADHAGRSMWKGETDVSAVSVGIELAGYHYTEITPQQYASLAVLIDILQRVYGLKDDAVLTHSQVAYGNPNRWIREKHRGRKRCAKNFERERAGCGPGPSDDPDVRAGRLTSDKELASIFYGRRPLIAAETGSNKITRNNSAWNIAGEDYDAPDTLYRLPDGRMIPGDQVAELVGWNRVPQGTEVFLNQDVPERATAVAGPVKTIGNGLTAWNFAGADYRKRTTHYFFPNGGISNGEQVSDWDELPPQTRLIVGYEGPFPVTQVRPPFTIAGPDYKDARTLYLFPDRTLRGGNTIRNFRSLPRGIKIFVPAEKT